MPAERSSRTGAQPSLGGQDDSWRRRLLDDIAGELQSRFGEAIGTDEDGDPEFAPLGEVDTEQAAEAILALFEPDDEMAEPAARVWEPETFMNPVNEPACTDAIRDAKRAVAAALGQEDPPA